MRKKIIANLLLKISYILLVLYLFYTQRRTYILMIFMVSILLDFFIGRKELMIDKKFFRYKYLFYGLLILASIFLFFYINDKDVTVYLIISGVILIAGAIFEYIGHERKRLLHLGELNEQ